MQSSSVPGSHFLPTIRPEDYRGNHFSTDLHAFPSHINSSFLPPELDSIKSSIDSSNPEPTTIQPNEDATYVPPKNLHSFPPNIEAVYPPPLAKQRTPANSYLPISSGDDLQSDYQTGDAMFYNLPKDSNILAPNIDPNEDTTSIPAENLYNFPPNIEAAYLPPSPRQNSPVNSYLPIPSGDDLHDDSQEDGMISYKRPENLNSFPPNIESVYPEAEKSKPLGSSYLSPPSGDKNAPEENKNANDNQTNNFFPYSYIPPPNPFNFPPNIQSSYLPPEMRQVKQSVNSYLPPASGSVSGFYEGSQPTITDAPQMNMVPPASMMDMVPPTAMDMAPPSSDDHHSDHPPW